MHPKKLSRKELQKLSDKIVSLATTSSAARTRHNLHRRLEAQYQDLHQLQAKDPTHEDVYRRWQHIDSLYDQLAKIRSIETNILQEPAAITTDARHQITSRADLASHNVALAQALHAVMTGPVHGSKSAAEKKALSANLRRQFESLRVHHQTAKEFPPAKHWAQDRSKNAEKDILRLLGKEDYLRFVQKYDRVRSQIKKAVNKKEKKTNW